MIPEEINVIRQAYKSHNGCAPEMCGGSSLDPCSLGHALDALTRAREELTTWIGTTWLHVLPEDVIRLPGKTQVAVIQSIHIGTWHADVKSRLMESGKWWDSVEAWDHEMIGVRLAHMPDSLLSFKTDAPVEILMDDERQAIHNLQVGFPGSERIE